MKKIFIKILKVVLIVLAINWICAYMYTIKYGYSYNGYLYRFIFNLFRITHIETVYFTVNISKFQWLSLNSGEDKNVPKQFWFVGYYINPETKKGDVFIVDINIEKNKHYIDYLKQTCYFTSNETINNFEVKVYNCNKELNGEKIIQKVMFYRDEYFIFSPYIDAFKPQYDKFFEGIRLKE
jgi:hypothetical protein